MWSSSNIFKITFLESLSHAWRTEILIPICSLLTFLVHLLKLHPSRKINEDEAFGASLVCVRVCEHVHVHVCVSVVVVLF